MEQHEESDIEAFDDEDVFDDSDNDCSEKDNKVFEACNQNTRHRVACLSCIPWWQTKEVDKTEACACIL